MSDHAAEATQSSRQTAPTAMAFIADPETEGLVRRAFADLGVSDVQVTRGGVESATQTLARQKSPRLLLVDVSGAADPLARVNELADACEPEIRVVVIGEKNDIRLFKELRSAGVSEYFFKPVALDTLKRVCNALLNGERADAPSAAGVGKLVFVLGVRGGVGATTVAVNAAMRLATKGQRWVMLLDLDLESGDSALKLGVNPTDALREALDRPERVDKLFLERGVLHVRERLDLLAGLDPFGAAPPREDAVIALIDKLLQRYRFVFVDLPPALAPRMSRLMSMPGATVLVSSASLASARDLMRWRAWLGPNSPERRTAHVLNLSGAEGALPKDEFIRAAGAPPDVIIPWDRVIAADATFGAEAARKSAALDRGLAPLLRELAGEGVAKKRSILRRLFG